LAASALVSSAAALVSGTIAGVLITEARLARRWVGVPTEFPPSDEGTYGFCAGEPLSMVILGDSSAAGLGVTTRDQTLGSHVARGLAAVAERPVRLRNVAVVGARSADLDRQVTQALQAHPDVAVIMIGVNDVTHRVAIPSADCQVVVGTCPDLGTIKPISQPLRYLARRQSRQLAAAQTIVVVEAGGRTVSLGDLIGPEFSAAPHEMFSPDRFHPSPAGYASAAMAVLPSVCAALGYWPQDEIAPDPAREEGVLTVAMAAVTAAERPGTEVAPAGAHDHRGGRYGARALLRHRRRAELPEPLSSPTTLADGDSTALGAVSCPTDR
jgi:lysophospholipase L1-like esterase